PRPRAKAKAEPGLLPRGRLAPPGDREDVSWRYLPGLAAIDHANGRSTRGQLSASFRRRLSLRPPAGDGRRRGGSDPGGLCRGGGGARRRSRGGTAATGLALHGGATAPRRPRSTAGGCGLIGRGRPRGRGRALRTTGGPGTGRRICTTHG